MGVSPPVLLLPLLLINLLFLGSHSSGEEVSTVDVHAARDLLRSGHRYLDVRTAEEFKGGHVDAEDSLNIPYMFITSQGRVKNPDFVEQVSSACSKDDRLVVVICFSSTILLKLIALLGDGVPNAVIVLFQGCQSGVRSLYATTDLLSAGFKHACNMGGGYVKWVESGFAVKKPRVEL